MFLHLLYRSSMNWQFSTASKKEVAEFDWSLFLEERSCQSCPSSLLEMKLVASYHVRSFFLWRFPKIGLPLDHPFFLTIHMYRNLR